MDDLQRLVAIEEIRRVKTRYWNGFDFKDPVLLRSAFDDAVECDYRLSPAEPRESPGYFTDPDKFVRDMLAILAGYASSHQGHSIELDFVSETEAQGVWAFSDHFWFKGDGDAKMLPQLGRRYQSWGHYHDRYRKTAKGWRIYYSSFKTLHVERS